MCSVVVPGGLGKLHITFTPKVATSWIIPSGDSWRRLHNRCFIIDRQHGADDCGNMILPITVQETHAKYSIGTRHQHPNPNPLSQNQSYPTSPNQTHSPSYSSSPSCASSPSSPSSPPYPSPSSPPCACPSFPSCPSCPPCPCPSSPPSSACQVYFSRVSNSSPGR